MSAAKYWLMIGMLTGLIILGAALVTKPDKRLDVAWMEGHARGTAEEMQRCEADMKKARGEE